MRNNEDEPMSKGDSNGEYSNTYSLWGNSKYYDINNLSPHNYFTKATSSDSDGPSEPSNCEGKKKGGKQTAKEEQDHRNRRIVTRENLHGEFVPSCKQENDQHDSDWTDTFWKKPGAQDTGAMTPMNAFKQVYRKEARVQEKLNKTLAQPVKMSKAESMMQKMGWQGGALGKTGEGIVEPIVPNVIYGTKLGLGTYTQTQAPSKPPPKVKKNKTDKLETFEINTLLYISEFVRNNTEVELLFDKQLTKFERKRVHQLVTNMLNVENLGMLNHRSDNVLDLAVWVIRHNCYVLETQSEGEQPHRMLCLYKMAPSDMYLIIPDDLRDEEEEDEVEEVEEIPVEPEEETNPFLQSITRNLKNCTPEEEVPKCGDCCKHDSKNVIKIMEFFTEFGESQEFTVFRHLGPFDKEELEAFNFFYEVAQKYLNGETICDKILPVLQKVNFEVNVDCNMHTVIYKKIDTEK